MMMIDGKIGFPRVGNAQFTHDLYALWHFGGMPAEWESRLLVEPVKASRGFQSGGFEVVDVSHACVR